MSKITVLILSAIFLSNAAFAEQRVVGSYNGIDVTEQQIMQQFSPMLEMQPDYKGKSFSQLDKKFQEMLVNGYINQKLFEKEAEKSGLRNSKEFKEKVKVAESQILQQELITKYLSKAVTSQMVDDAYKKLESDLKGQKETKVRHILVDSKEKAQEVKKKLNKGAKFADLAKEYSKDEGTKANSGELGYVLKEYLVPEFASKAFSMKKGEVSDPVQTKFGWHIIEVLDIRPVQIPTKEQAEAEIRAKLSREAIEKYTAELAKKANVKINI